MSITTEITSSGPYIATGLDQLFSVDFFMASASEIEVYADGELLATSAYAVTRLASGKGSIRPFPFLAAGTVVIIESAPNFLQKSVYTNSGGFKPASLTPDLDRAAARDLWLKARVGRIPPFPEIEEDDDGKVLGLAGGFLQWLANDPAAALAYALRAETAMAAAQQAQAIAELAAEGALFVGLTYYASPTGNNTNPGTPAQPWSLTHSMATANTVLLPGDTVAVTAGTYSVTQTEGFRAQKGGTVTRPIRYLAQGNAVIDGRITGLSWENVITETGRNIRRTTTTVVAPGTSNVVPSVWVTATNGKDYPLIILRYNDADGCGNATTGVYNSTTAYYPGPCAWIGSDGKLYVRGDNQAAGIVMNRPTAQLPSIDPMTWNARVCAGRAGISVAASNIVFDGLRIENCVYSVKTDYDGSLPRDSNITFKNGYDSPGYSSFLLGGIDHWTIDRWISDGGMRKDWWCDYASLKGGDTIAEPCRKVWVNLGDRKGDTANDPGISVGNVFKRFTASNFFDGLLGNGSYSTTLGDPALRTADDVTVMANAWTLRNMWDDAGQILSSWQGFVAFGGLCLGAGFSRDGSSSSAARGTDWPVIDRVYIDPTDTIFFGRQGAQDGDGVPANGWQGDRYPPTFSSHGLRSGGGDYVFHWTLNRVTAILRYPSVMQGEDGGMNLNLFPPRAGNSEGGKTFIFNFLLIDEADAASYIWLTDRYDADIADTELAGWRLVSDTHWAAQAGLAGGGLIGYIKIAGSNVAPPGGAEHWRSMAIVRSNATVLAASVLSYPGGAFASSGQTLANLADVLDPSGTPIHADLLTGAVDVSLRIPNSGRVRASVGAKPAAPAA